MSSITPGQYSLAKGQPLGSRFSQSRCPSCQPISKAC